MQPIPSKAPDARRAAALAARIVDRRATESRR